MPPTNISVIPAQAGIQFVDLTALKINQMNNLDSGVRRNDGHMCVRRNDGYMGMRRNDGRMGGRPGSIHRL